MKVHEFAERMLHHHNSFVIHRSNIQNLGWKMTDSNLSSNENNSPFRLTMNHQLVLYTRDNYQKIYTSNEYIFYKRKNTIGLICSSGNHPNYYLPDESGMIFETLVRLKEGVCYWELMKMLSPFVDDPETFVAELWQKGALL